MANYYSHYRYRPRTFEYSRLTQNDLKTYSKLPIDSKLRLTWSARGDNVLELVAIKREGYLFIESVSGRSYPIYFNQTSLTYGSRNWYSCPACGRRCAVLYHSGIFACRKCAKPSYSSQNDSEHECLANRIIKLRTQLWGDKWPCNNDLMENCIDWPKPKGKHWNKFYRDRAAIIRLEKKRFMGLSASIDNLLVQFRRRNDLRERR
jgi:ribosomal protein L37AE/L43A